MNNKIAVVTGFAGFIGTTFTQLLLRKGWKVYGIDKFTHVANYTHLKYDRNQFTWIQEDIKDIKWLPECDVVFNFAAESDVDIGNQNCSNFIQSNIDGVRNLLELINNRIVIRSDKPLFFQMSTDEVYGDIIDGEFNEQAILNPSNPYSASKAAADLLMQSWERTHGLEYGIARHSKK